jgi:pimeloyl-ACP methyl ester carboxylesterase
MSIAATSRLVVSAALVGLLSSSLSGCFLLPLVTDRGTSESSSPTPRPHFEGDFAEYFNQELAWDDCGPVQCAEIDVPIDWEDPASDSVTIALAKQEAYGRTTQGTIFVNPGGPGGSGVDFVQYAVSDTLAESFDVIGWDPRGVGASTQVRCFDDADKDEMLYGTFDSPYLTEGWIAELEADAKDFADACVQNTGELLAHLDTVSTAHDLELMRVLVTWDRPLDYLGYSYGTYIGATYAELFPEHVGRFVLDGAVDPQLDAFDELVVQMVGFENGFRAWMEDCLNRSTCPFSGSLDSGLQQANALIASVDGMGLVSSDGRALDAASVGTGVAMSLYSESLWPDLRKLFIGLQDGDADPSFYLADMYNDRFANGGYAGNTVEVYEATTCVDNDFTMDEKSTLQRMDEIAAAAPTIGEFIALDDYAVLDVTCSNWPYPAADAPTEYDAEGAAPILVIGTSNDPATPYAWAKSLAGQLDSGVLISVEGEGHTAYNGGNSCVDDVVDGYFLDDVVPKQDPDC